MGTRSEELRMIQPPRLQRSTPRNHQTLETHFSVARLFYFFVRVCSSLCWILLIFLFFDLLSSASLLGSSFFFLSHLGLFPPLLLHLSILSEIWRLNFHRSCANVAVSIRTSIDVPVFRLCRPQGHAMMVEDDQELDNAVPYRIVCEDEIHRIPSWGCVFYPEIPAEYRILSGNQNQQALLEHPPYTWRIFHDFPMHAYFVWTWPKTEGIAIFGTIWVDEHP